ncbi:hypothetical protein Dtox_2862 [Desulfofarcimen acetoxidans DSM 771]|uniref:Glycosyltransferase RgtA/B/C/D-like domain-containing protein n=1 Tax=Desulfofarcimen acetoxidans (strain ATCC 49208 / DSM 771 / KCTC 5769 / VKM B-1644 / 5575) TaxID=485916 RepID=C8W2E3_DESAS|nr:hypothetical protein [Desulfofarcimen acetoxidans]ACV63627.1 hypothetical protein Dtox_2862 [Desulfofarcimen acetoxidans DSM 771]
MEKHPERSALEPILFLALAVIASLLVYDKMVIFAVVILFAAVVFFLADGYRIPREESSVMWKLILSALLVRIVFIVYTLAFDNPFMRADGITYALMGGSIAEAWHEGRHVVIHKLNYGYYYYNAFIFYITGYHPTVVRLINSIIGVGAALNLYFISLRLSGRKAAKFTFALAAFFPSFIVWSALNLKESIIVFCITYITKKIMEIISEFRISNLIAIAIALLPLVALRFYVGILVGIVLAFTFVISGNNFRWDRRISYTLLILFVAGVVLLQMGYGFLGKDYVASQSLETIEQQHKAGAIGDSSYAEDVDFSSPIGAMKYLPKGLFYFVFGPLPWQSGGYLKIISLPEMLMLYILYLYVMRGVSRLWCSRHGECMFLIILISSFTLIYALGGSNMGGIYRVRFQVLSLLFIFISHGMVGQVQYNWLQIIRDRVKLRSG